ncbi:MAG TPA: TraM recognition domain-containing protein [Solirubrobacteraceae bacterium]|nr:TraM recognition domain-containing protein [Solirubrobacteraceae bacterium]
MGRSVGVDCWSSVEDSMVVVGPPRSGKGLHIVIPAIVDAPGAVVTTSTRPDNLSVAWKLRQKVGPVAVFDPQGIASGMADVMRWSPIRGCERPAVAMARARALCADASEGVENASFWAQQSFTAVRCLLHAAAIEHRMPIDLLRWSLSALAAEEALDILRSNPAAAPTWSTALEGILTADPRQRDSVWAMVGNVFSALSDPAVLEAVSPAAGEALDPEALLRQRGSLFLIGTSIGASATATLVSALIEDVVETARAMAGRSAGARLETPLSLVLDEAANYPLPSLLPLMSEGGGSGISTMAVVQSLAQARARWGRDAAAAIWDAAIVKVILGGGAGSEDLRDLSALLGVRERRRTSHSRGDHGSRSTSVSTDEYAVYDVNALRTLPFGRAILLLRSAPPIDLRLQPWTKRKDASLLRASRDEVERLLRIPGAAA